MKLTPILSVFLSLVIITQGAPINFSKRRFGNESSPKAVAIFQEIKSTTEGTNKETEGADLSVKAIEALFVDAPACDQQDRADDIIDLGRSLGGEKETKLIEVAKLYRQLERNTPDGQPSELCANPPKNTELNGLFQAQDTVTPNEPDPDDPSTVTPNEPDPDDPSTVTPNEPDPDDPSTVTPNEPDPDDPSTVTPNEPDPDEPSKNGSGDGKVLPKDSDEDSERNDDGSSVKSKIPQGFE